MSKPLRMSKHLFHHHVATDQIRSARYEVTGHADPEVALIISAPEPDAADTEHDHTLYVHRDDVPGMVVALLANTAFLEQQTDPTINPVAARLVHVGQLFVDAYREAMVPQFRQRFQQAMDEATSDWDLKCRMATIVDEYEQLR